MKPTKIFKFQVDSGGTFLYDPPGDWAYTPSDVIRFESPSGDFTIHFIPKGAPPRADFNPLGGPLNSTLEEYGTFAVETTVNDGLNDQQRDAIKTMHKSPADPLGFIAKYFYAISVKDANGRIVFKDDTHNGTYSC